MHLITATLLSAGLLAAAETCTGPSYGGPQAGNTTVITLNGAGQSGRSFRLRLPGGYDGTSKRPVYWSFHGGGKNASQQESLSSLSDDNYNPDGIAVYPDGEETTQGSGKRYWLSHPGIPQASPNDLDFFLEITAWLDSNICYDTNKVYATGKSNGGGFVNLLACNSTTASKLAAVASVSGAYYMSKQAKACKPNKVVPFLSFHGLNDTTIPYTGKNGGDEDGGDDDDDDDSSDVPDFKKTYPITNWTAAWAKRDGVTTLPLNESLYDGLVTRYTWSNSAGVVVQHYKEGNFGHVWPSLYPNLDCPAPSAKCPDGHYVYNATTIILNWFKGYTLSR